MSAPGAAAETPGSAAPRLSAAGDGRMALAGSLTFATARSALDLGERTISAGRGEALEVDCAGVTAADSAGLAVLLEWLRAAKIAGRRLRFSHLPPGLVALARISEVEQLLARGV
jgi:phospholipid transport system transporter-binding protein